MPKTTTELKGASVFKTTIQLNVTTKTLLTEQGKMGETYDQLLFRLLKELEELRNSNERKKQQKR